MPTFNVELSDLTIDARFSAPNFNVLAEEGRRTLAAMCAALAPFGTGLNDVTFGQTGTLADRNAYFAISRYNAGVKLTVANVEIGFNDLSKVTFEIIQAVIRAAGSALPGMGIGLYSVSMNSHGRVDGMSGAAFTAPLVGRAPEGLGPLTRSGAVFYYGARGPIVHTGLVVDSSMLVPDGVFVRVLFGVAGNAVSFDTLPELGRRTAREAFASLRLQVPNF